MAEMPERPSSAAFQNSATPIPIGETIPYPVMTTRAGIAFRFFVLYGLVSVNRSTDISTSNLQ